jgi:2'-5' RNA ligase
MGHISVWLNLDTEAERVVLSLWQQLSRAGVSSKLIDMGSRPHVSMGVFEGTEAHALMASVRSFAVDHEPFKLRFIRAGSFGGEVGVVFLAPVVTTQLLAFHRAFFEQIAGVNIQPWAHYLPGAWVPHCTTAFGLPPGQIGPALRMTRECGLPFISEVRSIGVQVFDSSVDTKIKYLDRVPLGRAGPGTAVPG